MDLLQHFSKQFAKHQLSLKGHRYILAISGGHDSVVLLKLCLDAGMRPALAHMNFNLRAEESLRDEAFVRELAREHQLELFVRSVEVDRKTGIQESARNLRYSWFSQLLQEHSYDYILVAHHQDDQAETILMSQFRGTGISGLRGMPALDHQRKLFRPLIEVSQERLKDFALANQLRWVEDSSNQKTDYTRNKIRHQLIPVIRSLYPDFAGTLQSNAARLRDVEGYYRLRLTEDLRKLGFDSVKDFQVPVLKLQKFRTTSIPYELLKAFGGSEKQLDDFVSLLDAQTGKFIWIGERRVFRHRRWLIFNYRVPLAEMQIVAGTGEFSLQDGRLSISEAKPGIPPTDPWSVLLDASEISFPLILRPWKAGDYFYPLGMPHKKKLARFFIDARIPRADKERMMVLESAGRIIWVVGQRIDHRFRITPSTQKFLSITFERDLL